MRVILLSDLLHCGRQGEEIDVKPGFARNYLFPQQLALEATPANRVLFKQRRKEVDARQTRERDEAARIAEQLTGLALRIEKRVSATQTLYGSVTATEVAELLKEKGFTVDRRRIDLLGGIKTVGEHLVRIDFHPDVAAEVTVTVVAAE
jgi:large subunit ribosomal protein L9